MSTRQHVASTRQHVLAAVVSVMLCSTPAGGASDATNHIVLSGQDALIAELVGLGQPLGGGCRFTGGTTPPGAIRAAYACPEGAVTIELRHPDDGEAGGLYTERFALRTVSGRAPPALLADLTARIRAREAAFAWGTAEPTPSLAAYLRRVAVVIGLALVAQILALPRRTSTGIPRPVSGASFAPAAAIVGLFVAYFLTRTLTLTVLPVFSDEAVHIAWMAAPGTPGELLVGKWLPLGVMRLFAWLPVPPLVAARLGSVSMGGATLLACILIGGELFAWPEGLVAGLLYVLLPYTLLYDRLALADIYLTAFAAYAVLFALRAARRPTVANAVGLGLCTYASILAKPSAVMYALVPVLVGGVVVPRGARRAYLRISLPVAAAAGLLFLTLVRSGYGLGLMIDQTAPGFRPALVLENAPLLWAWATGLLGSAIVWATLAASVWAVARRGRRHSNGVFPVALLLVAVLPYTLAARTWYPRYVLFAVVPICLLLGRAIVSGARAMAAALAQRTPALRARLVPVSLIAAAVIVLSAGNASTYLALLAQPAAAALPAVERAQYISGPLAGFGLPELAEHLHEAAGRETLNVVRFSLDGPPRQGLDVYLHPSSRLRVHTLNIADPRTRAALAQLVAQQPTFLVVNTDRGQPWPAGVDPFLAGAVRVWHYPRPGGQSGLELWQLPHAPAAPAHS